MTKNTLSNRNKNKVNTHDNSCHTETYVTIHQVMKNIKKSIEEVYEKINLKIKSLKHDDLNEVDSNQHIDGTLDNEYTIHPNNITLDTVKQYEGELDHNSLSNYKDTQHIDGTSDNEYTIHPNNITLNTVKQYESELDHNNLVNYDSKDHVDGTSDNEYTIHSNNITLNTVKQYESELDHNGLTNYNSKEHIDGTVNQPKNILLSNIETPNHNQLVNYKDDEHIPHSRIGISPGEGLYGGGTINTNRTLGLKPATKDRLGGIKVGKGLNITKNSKHLNIDETLIPIKYEFEITKEDGEKVGSKYKFSFETDIQYPCVFCGDLTYDKIVYPDINIEDIYIILSMKRRPKLLVKVLK